MLGQELAAWPVGVLSSFRKLWLSLTMGERAGFRLAHDCRSSSAQALWSPVTHRHFPLPCLSCGPTGYVRNLESRDGREWALRFELEMTSNGHHQLSLPLFPDPPKVLGCIQVISERNSSNVPSNVPEVSDLSPGLEHSDAILSFTGDQCWPRLATSVRLSVP